MGSTPAFGVALQWASRVSLAAIPHDQTLPSTGPRPRIPQMQHQHWIDQARQHWQEFQPARFKELTDSGQLEAALRRAAEWTAEEMSKLIDRGVNAGDAWMEVRELHLFPAPEPGAVEEQGQTEGYLVQVRLMRELKALFDDE